MAFVPVVIGVGDFKNPSTRPEDAVEPLDLMLTAIDIALQDSGLPETKLRALQASIDSVAVVRTWTWPYPDLPRSISERLGLTAKHEQYSAHGGNSPAKLFDEAARRISQGSSRVALVTGGEALASLNACAKVGKLPPPGWTKPAEEVKSVFSPTGRDLGSNLGALHRIGAPIHVYPLYENAWRQRRGQSLQENNTESAELYAAFARTASSHPSSWNYGKAPATASFIGSPSKGNRMICTPYPLLMNAFNTVNVAGACILASTEVARELGVPESKWIYPLGGAGTKDADNFWDRPNFHSSPSIIRSLDAAFDVSGISKDDIDIFDFYSCFPIVPKIACDHLGISTVNPEKPITLLGGLTSFGGAGNNYSMHALTEMVRQLRSGNGKVGCVLANGGVLSYQHVVCLSSAPRNPESVYPQTDPLPEKLTYNTCPTIAFQPEGEAEIEVSLCSCTIESSY